MQSIRRDAAHGAVVEDHDAMGSLARSLEKEGKHLVEKKHFLYITRHHTGEKEVVTNQALDMSCRAHTAASSQMP